MSHIDEKEWLAERFEENRLRLRAIAYRMLGSTGEAEDAVQETWLRLNRSDANAVKNLNGWLTTVVSRICLDVLRVRRMRGETALNVETSEQIKSPPRESDPEQELLLADSVGIALLVVLETLTPAERLAFVLHDSFGISFDEIARITGRTPVAARQLASRARRRVRGKTNTRQASRPVRHQKIIEAFFAAARDGDFERLVALLDPNAVLRADREASPSGAAIKILGASAVVKGARMANTEHSEVAIVNNRAAIISAPGGRLRRALLFTVARKKITRIDVVANRNRLDRLKIIPLSESNFKSKP